MLSLTISNTSLLNYRLVTRYVLGDALWRFKRRIFTLAALGALGVFMQGSGLAAALLYARSLESGSPFDLFGLQLDPRSDPELLGITAGVLTVAILVGGYFLYRFRSGAIALGREYEAVRIRDTLVAASNLPHPGVPDSVSLLDEAYIDRVQRDSRVCGRVLRTIVQGFVPAIVVPIGALVLLVLNPSLTAFLIAITTVVGVLMFRINRRGARASDRMERLSKQASRERRDAVRDILEADASTHLNPPDLGNTGNVKGHLDAYTDRLQATENSGLASSLVTGIALGAILLIEGRDVLSGDSSISALLTYLVVLRIFLTHFMRLSRSITSVSRFYPQMKRHYSFTREATKQPSTPSPTAPISRTLHLPPLHSQVDDPYPQVREGARLALLTDGSFTRKTLASLSAAFAADDQHDAQTPFICKVEPLKADSADLSREALRLSHGTDINKLKRSMGSVLSQETIRQLFNRQTLDATSSVPESPPHLEFDDLFTISFMAGLNDYTYGLVVEIEHWQALPPKLRRRLLDEAREKLLIFHSSATTPLPEGKFDLVLFATPQAVLGWSPPAAVATSLQRFWELRKAPGPDQPHITPKDGPLVSRHDEEDEDDE